MEGTILGMPDTFTGVTLRFLRGTSRHPCGASVQIVGLGDFKTEAVRDVVKAALRRVQTIVANAKKNMKLYRPEHCWLHAFTAFRLPSPLSATDAGATEAATAPCLQQTRSPRHPEKHAHTHSGNLVSVAIIHSSSSSSVAFLWARAPGAAGSSSGASGNVF